MISLIIGYILDLIVGDPHNPYHPVRFIGNLCTKSERLFRKIFKKNLKLAGLIVWILVVSIVFSFTLGIVYIFNSINLYLGILVQGIIIYFCISGKGLVVEGNKVIKELKNDNIVEARKKLSYIVGRDTENLNQTSIMKAVIETIAENMSDGVIAPLFYAGIFGAPLGMAYKAVNTMDSMFGYKNDKYKEFGYFPAKMDDLFNLIPARMTALFIIISSLILRYDFKNSIKIYFRDRYNHTSPNSAHPEAAMAGALDIELGGANYYFGKLVNKPTIGDAIKKVEIKDVKRSSNVLYLCSFIGVIVSSTIIYIIR